MCSYENNVLIRSHIGILSSFGFVILVGVVAWSEVWRVAWCVLLSIIFGVSIIFLFMGYLVPSPVLSQVMWSEVFLCCSKWLEASIERTQEGFSPWDLFFFPWVVGVCSFGYLISWVFVLVLFLTPLFVFWLCFDMSCKVQFSLFQFNIFEKNL